MVMSSVGPVVAIILICFSDVTATEESTPPCNVTQDPADGGTHVDCSGRGLSRLDADWFPESTTSLRLDHNPLGELQNGTFSRLTQLQSLSAIDCQLRRLQHDSLRGLGELRFLNLQSNQLSVTAHAFPRGTFRHTPQLQTLYIDDNSQQEKGCSYENCTDVLTTLPRLQRLAIDAFPELYIGPRFPKLEHLKTLRVNCNYVTSITNSSLEGLRKANFTEFILNGGRNYIHFETGVFEPISYVKVLRISFITIGNQNILKSLWPFKHKKMTLLELSQIFLHHTGTTPVPLFNDGILDKENMQFLNSIYLSNLILFKNKIFSLQPHLFMSGDRCLMKSLKTLKYIGNAESLMDEWRIVIFEILSFKALEELWYTGPLPKFRSLESVLAFEEDTCPNDSHIKQLPKKKKILHSEGTTFFASSQKVHNTTSHALGTSERSGKVESSFTSTNAPMRNRRGAMIVSFPKTLKVFVIALLSSQLEIPSFTFKNCDNLREVRLVDITYVLMTGSIKGCENLCLFDISRSFVRIETKQNPVRHFPNLSVLKMNSLQNAHDVMNKFTQNRWTENLSFLQEVQLSNNVLRSLPSDLFKNNINLKRLRLSGNRFSSVPVQVTTTAALEHLDLMDNSIVSLDTRTMRSLDEHVLTVPTFSVVLQGNTINCACSEITFLVWLHTTLVNLDDPELYRCINDRGVVTKLGNLQSAKAIWRRCVGREALLTSLFLAACITIGFLSVYLVRRFKTALQVFILRMVTPGFRMKGPRDYGNDVFIGYADDDFRFVRYVLRRHLEEELGVSTYIHQRDNRGGYFDDQIVDAVGDSWRLILLLSDNFLRHYSKAHLTMKLCAAAPSPLNPESVMVLLEEGQGRHVPDYLMAVVDEDRVVRLDPQAQRLTYEQKQKIRHWLSE